MTKSRFLLSMSSLALVALSLTGCGGQAVATTEDETDSALLSNVAVQRSGNAPELRLDMIRFDEGIGDTASGVGGGGNAE